MNILYNTKKRGFARTIIFKSGNLFKAVCLDFDIIEEAETREGVDQLIREAIIGYIKNVYKNKLDDKLLNRHAEKRYWDIYKKHLELIKERNSLPKAETAKLIDLTSMFTIPINSYTLCQS